jgi:hypothetical protein
MLHQVFFPNNGMETTAGIPKEFQLPPIMKGHSYFMLIDYFTMICPLNRLSPELFDR